VASNTRKPPPVVLTRYEGALVWKLPLSQGKFALVDKRDAALVALHVWCAYRARNTYYATTHVRKTGGQRTTLRLHALVGRAMGIAGRVDHENHQGLDCRRKNLRPGPPTLNGANSNKQRRKTSSKYKGVYWRTSRQKWLVTLQAGGKRRQIGSFADEVEAARAYDKAALEAWGEYATLNFPKKSRKCNAPG
jgi:hypothetical protein